MDVVGKEVASVGRASLLAPRLGKTDKEGFVIGEVAEDLGVEGVLLVGLPCEVETSSVGDILSEGLLAVDVTGAIPLEQVIGINDLK